MKTVGLVLSGGGALGIAHLALIKTLETYGLRPNIISGTSAGACIGTLYSLGHSPEAMLEIIRKEPWFFIDYKLLKQNGMLDAHQHYASFDTYIPEEFPTEHLYITTFDLIQGESVYYNSGDLRAVLKAACALSTFFKPIVYEGKTIVDAGLSNNFPVEPLVGQCDLLIGSYVMPKIVPQELQLQNTQQVINRIFTINGYNSASEKFGVCDFVFDHHYLKDYKVLDAEKLDEIYELSLVFCERQLKKFVAEASHTKNKLQS